jgi:chorismate mutase/prephenate dehydrogenase
MSNQDQSALNAPREQLDRIDAAILDLLAERKQVVEEVIARKVAAQLPVYVAGREQEKTERFREQAEQRGLDPDWAEDFLRMIMSASRNSQSQDRFPCATEQPKRVLMVGGEGRMARLYGRFLEQSGHEVRVLDQHNWYALSDLVQGVELAIVSVPIHATEAVIQRLAPKLPADCVLADFTSNKGKPVQAMLAAHAGPVLGFHPMHGPDVANLSRQLMVVSPGRDAERGQWFCRQCELWGMRLIEADPGRHDHVMNLVQGLRHFVALLHGSFMRSYDLRPRDMLEFSSPIYRAELMMTGRIFSQSAELYADIVFANAERRELLLAFFQHHGQLAKMVEGNDREGFIREFEAVTDFFGDFASQALEESGYLINRLADRFS